MDIYFDVLIVGSGVSGLYCALNLSPNLNILVVSKSKLDETNTSLAQGGISTARNTEDFPLFLQDTLKAGKYENDRESVKILVRESIENIQNILNLGVNLDRSENGLFYTREGAHSKNRIVHYKDKTGKAVEDSLLSNIKKRNNIVTLEDACLTDLIKSGNTCTGAVVFKENEQINIHSKVVVLATGGIGGLFHNSTNRRFLVGDGISIALKNNVNVENLHYIQFHPTALYDEDFKSRRFLISESVRGEGGKLLNSKGQRFVDELLPRDVVSKAIFKEIQESGVPYVNLDISFLDKNYIINRFPTIYNECLKKGIDITHDPIPVSPAQHYLMGGIKVDYNSKTSMNNLYAVGESSCTGVHGANRLASNSLLEGLVFSRRAANSINKQIRHAGLINVQVPRVSLSPEALMKENKNIIINELKRRSRELNDELFDN